MSPAANPFPVYSEEDWRKAAAAALKGGSLEKLISKTSDGVAFGPIHSAASGPRALKRGQGGWKVLARLDHPDAGAANEAALEDLANGADGLVVAFAGAAGAYGFGLARWDSATLHRAFEGARFDEGATFALDLGPEGEAQARAFAALIGRSGADISKVDVAFGLDPLGLALRSGRAAARGRKRRASLRETAKALKALGFRGPFVAADGRAIHAAGGTPAQELAYALGAARRLLASARGPWFFR